MAKTSLFGRDILSFGDLSPDEVAYLLESARTLKKQRNMGTPLAGKSLALVFEKPSMRTKSSFTIGMHQLGGHVLYLGPDEVGLGKREPVYDVGKVLATYVDVIACRTFAQQTLIELARAADVPVINALSDEEHPCQALADILTILEVNGSLRGIEVAFIGDGNNVAASLALAVASTGGVFRLAAPQGYDLPKDMLEKTHVVAKKTGAKIATMRDPREAVRGADVVYTDVWTSMGQETASAIRRKAFAGYQVNEALMALAKPSAIFLHDMPAHYGEEVPTGFLDHPQSRAYQQAENRLHAQKALVLALLAQ
ncbi:MAG: ornithine carbamoyltransferase [Dehalococcoidia bacterium]|nr:ornithine carbamoyltransferase [Dehalococcoidia bacterium]